MKNNKRAIKKILSAVLAGAMMMTTAAAVTASADETFDTNSYETYAADNMDNMDLSAIKHSPAYLKLKQEQEQKEKEERKKDQITGMYLHQKKIELDQFGLYHAKSVKLYGRRVLSINDDGSFNLGNREVIRDMSMHCLKTYKFYITGDYVEFAFSFDVTRGTDFPYSGVFWDEAYNNSWNNIRITMGGAVRTASINIKVGGNTVVDESNCSSHSEWRP